MVQKIILILGIVIFSFQLNAFENRKECKADIKTLCPDKKGKERKECLFSKKDEASPACQAAINAALEKRNKKYPCAVDRDAYCKDVEKGKGRVYKCLVENKEKLSLACSQRIEAKMAKIDAKKKEREEKKQLKKDEKKNKKPEAPPIPDEDLVD